jgi:hypothetical protein
MITMTAHGTTGASRSARARDANSPRAPGPALPRPARASRGELSLHRTYVVDAIVDRTPSGS